MSKGMNPVRTCIATHKRFDDAHLLRMVIDPNDHHRILADPGRGLPGRGAWITPELSALEKALQRRAFARAFKTSRKLDAGHVRTYLEARAASPTRECKEDRH
ncbi:YlxR family protein [Corynebacterium pseudodiphtheriticum]|uniref:YlxR family protein n=2 Tax=Corynebacterium pseudodiphtheriticum TaxID=37637 RepID=A0AAP4F581_9CORY|nr:MULTISPECIES: YlxR family protein [Corynebacterium]ERJ45735.1 DNA-binding protein [Corynebacterium pseudodiphtheriticum 090104]ERS38307.1 hypothetical protein HMPREF1292_01475 [Corynebacterium sp. KPL1995]ERS71647.1 hypothetical protein HMPREF1290_01481 [Corynebacterium sp. KPL1989]MCG7251631.1 YlxR family protein [Corynebacterium pseudodiphtheriticum]MDC7068762.1 YlxR family protein [Corynebacterium pseudodiphtheriticum]